MIVIKNLGVYHFGEPLFEKVSLVIHPSERVAVVGSNVDTVTTFFRVLADEVEMDEGTVRADGERLLYLSPESLEGDASALTQVFHTRPTFLFINVGSTQLQPDVVKSLTQIIQGFRGGILIATKDASLIRAAKTTKVFELNSPMKALISYTGTYDAYVLEKEKRDVQISEAYEKQQREKRRLEEWLVQKRKEAASDSSPEKGATIRTKAKYLKREILDKEIPNPNQD
jgi:ATPase subunit of ABC transporter with duplicated ATPase domains